MGFAPEEFTPEQKEKAKALFAQGTSFVLGVAKLEQLPLCEWPEAAFAGRSNVGKSSIINAVTGQKGLAKTSNTPGRTQQLNYFNLADKIHLVDLPGYGFAQAPEQVVKQWQKVIFAYLQGRVNLKRVFLLIDSRHGLSNRFNQGRQNKCQGISRGKEKNRDRSGKTRCRLCKSSGNQFGKKHRHRRAAGGNILPDINSCAFSQNSIS